MRVLSLCSGIGGLELGLKRAAGASAQTVCYVERDLYCASVLAARMEDGYLDSAPIWSCVKAFDGKPWRGVVDLITGGYPCQPFSAAGKRKGEDDPRHLWPHIRELVRTIGPSYVFCENVPGHLSLGFEQVCADLQDLGYGIEAGLFSAAEVGALHIRQRLFFIAYADGGELRQSDRGRQREGRQSSAKPQFDGEQGDMADRYDAQWWRKAQLADTVRTGLSQRQAHGRADQAQHTPSKRSGRGEGEGSMADAYGQLRWAGKTKQRNAFGGRGGLPRGREQSHDNATNGGPSVADADRVRELQSQGGVSNVRGRTGDGGSTGHGLIKWRGAMYQHEAAGRGPAKSGMGRALNGIPQKLDPTLTLASMEDWGPGWEDGTRRTIKDLPHRMDRVKSLGNAVVPAVAAHAWTTLYGRIQQRREKAPR